MGALFEGAGWCGGVEIFHLDDEVEGGRELVSERLRATAIFMTSNAEVAQVRQNRAPPSCSLHVRQGAAP